MSLREHDGLLEFIRSLVTSDSDGLGAMTFRQALKETQHLITQTIQSDMTPRLKRLVPSIGNFFTMLDLESALDFVEQTSAISARRHVPPSYREIRTILNIAQIHAIIPTLKLITFDADNTIYSDGANLKDDSPIIPIIIRLLKQGIHVGIVTSAGYPGQVERYHERIGALLQGFHRYSLSQEEIDRFWFMGGQCNYLFQCNSQLELVEISTQEFQTAEMKNWSDKDIKHFLHLAAESLKEAVTRLKIENYTWIEKERSIGMVPGLKTNGHRVSYEELEEIAKTVASGLKGVTLPYCAFNGGRDVWIDAGNKRIGIECLQHFVQKGQPSIQPHETLHVGDRFTSTGNDLLAREVGCTLWIANPFETVHFLHIFLNGLSTS